MNAFDIKDRKVLRYLFEKNKVVVTWIDLIIDLKPKVVGKENHESAKLYREELIAQNDEILDAMTGD